MPYVTKEKAYTTIPSKSTEFVPNLVMIFKLKSGLL